MIALHRRAARGAVLAALALTGTVATFGLTTQPAAAATGYYTASLAAPLDAPKQVIAGGVLWKCAGQTCNAAQDSSRDVMVCARLARKLESPLAGFATPRGALAEPDLARCNAR